MRIRTGSQTRFFDIVPPGASIAECDGDLREGVAWPEETEYAFRCAQSRAYEFLTGRACLRAALGALGQAPGPIPVGDGRQPVLPAGFVGSITHTLSFRAAVAIRQSAGISIGIDAETDEALDIGARDLVLGAGEYARATELVKHCGPAWDKIVFSAKESFYKALYPLRPAMLDFAEVEVIPNAPGHLWARVCTVDRHSGQPSSGLVRFQHIDGHVATVATIHVS